MNTMDNVLVDYDPFVDGEIINVIPLLESQKEIWLLCMIGGMEANCAYNQTMSMVLEGHLNYKAMEQAVHGMVERHEALRCSFSRDGQQVYIYSEGKTTLTYNDLSHLNAADQQSFLTEYARENSRTPFDLEAGSLLRVFLFKLAADRHVLLFTVHHIVCDGWSISLFLE